MTFIIIIFEVQYNDLYFLRKLFNELQLGSISEDLKEPYQFPFLGKSIVFFFFWRINGGQVNCFKRKKHYNSTGL